mgnify:CR=1 FL=1
MTPGTDAIIARYKLARHRMTAAGLPVAPVPGKGRSIYNTPCGPKFMPPEPVPPVPVLPILTHSPPLRAILWAVAGVTGIPSNEILSARRPRRAIPARFVMSWLARELTVNSYPRIGRAYCRDHTSIMHGCKKVDARREDYQAMIDAVMARLAIAHGVCNSD